MREMKHEYNIFLPVVILNEQKCKRENIHVHTMCFALYILFSYTEMDHLFYLYDFFDDN